MTTEQSTKTWHRYRLKVGEILSKAKSDWLRDRLRTVVLDLDYEGPPICGGIYTSLHTCYEECLTDANHYGDDFETAIESDTNLQDWAMNAHHGLCPDDIAHEILQLFG